MNFMMHQTGVGDGVRDDYEQRFPPDDPGTECGPRARVWRVYNEEAREYDLWMVTNLRENLDVLLVFAALFSGVVTTFVAQTSQNLQPDRGLQSSLLLTEMVRLQRAAISGSGPESVPITSMEALNPSPSGGDLWVNGLWFASLTLSLTTALLAALARQWLHYYVTAGHSGTPRDMCRLRQFRLMGMEQWRVSVIVGFLPFCLHLSLAIFLAGLIVLLWDLSRPLAYMVGAVTGMAYVSYIGSIGLSMIFPNCPYRTGLSNIAFLLMRNLVAIATPIKTFFVRKEQTMESNPADSDGVGQLSVSQREKDAIQQMGCELDARMLQWPLQTSSNPSVRAVVIRAIAGLPIKLDHSFLRSMFPTSFGLEQDYKLRLGACSEYTWEEGARPKWECINEVEQLTRFKRRLFPGEEKVAPLPLSIHDEPFKWACASTLIISFSTRDADRLRAETLNLAHVMQRAVQSLEMWHELFRVVFRWNEMRQLHMHGDAPLPFTLFEVCEQFLMDLAEITGRRNLWIEDQENQSMDDAEQAISFKTALLCPAKDDRESLYDIFRNHFLDVFGSFVDIDLAEFSPGLALIISIIKFGLGTDSARVRSSFIIIARAVFVLRCVVLYGALDHTESYAIFQTIDMIFTSGILCDANACQRQWICESALIVACRCCFNRVFLTTKPWLHFSDLRGGTYWRIQQKWLLVGIHANLKTLMRDDLVLQIEPGEAGSESDELYHMLSAASHLMHLLAVYWVLDEPGVQELIENFVAIDGLNIVFKYKFAVPWFPLMHAFVRYLAKSKIRHPSHAAVLERYLFTPENHFSVALCLTFLVSGIPEADIHDACITLVHLQPRSDVWISTLKRLDEFIQNEEELTTSDKFAKANGRMGNWDLFSIEQTKRAMGPRIELLKDQLAQYKNVLTQNDGNYSPEWLGSRSLWTGDRGPDAILASIPPPEREDSVYCTPPVSPDLMVGNILSRIKRIWKRKKPPFSNNHGNV